MREPKTYNLRPGLRVAGGAASWRRLAMRAVVSLAMLAGWLAFSHALLWFLGEWEENAESGRVGKIFRFYLRHWEKWTGLGAFWCMAFWGVMPLWRAMQTPRFSDGVVGVATPGTLGAIRAWTCGILLVLTLREDLASSTLLPRAMFHDMGFMALLHLLPVGFDGFLTNAAALRLFQALTTALLAFGVVGLGSRLVVPASAICYFVLGGIYREHSFFNHGGIVPLYVLIVLSFTRCDRGWAVDRIRRATRGEPAAATHTPTAYFGWARYAVWTVIASAYVQAGCSKLYYMGLNWVSADSMRWMLLRTTLELDGGAFDFDMAVRLVAMPDMLFVLLGVVALGTELGFGLVLVSRRARSILPAAMAGVHVGILFLQNILFLDLILLLCVFYDWDAPRRWLAGRRGAVDPHDADTTRVRDAALDRPAGTHRLGALAVLAMLLFLASWWVTKIELYPLTPLKMFTSHEEAADAGVVSYVRAIVHYEDGSSGRAPFENWIGAMRGGRFRPVVRNTFRDNAGLEIGKQFLDAVIRAANIREDDGPRVSSVELQTWQWNFKEDPDNPDYGVMTDRYLHPAPR